MGKLQTRVESLLSHCWLDSRSITQLPVLVTTPPASFTDRQTDRQTDPKDFGVFKCIEIETKLLDYYFPVCMNVNPCPLSF